MNARQRRNDKRRHASLRMMMKIMARELDYANNIVKKHREMHFWEKIKWAFE